MNIATMAAQYLTPMVVENIAKSLGITNPMAQKAIAAIVPTILASLLGASQKPAGLSKITDILGKADTGMLGKLGELVGGPSQDTIIGAGTGVLGSLLGESALGSLTGALGKFAGLEDKASTGLLGLVGPVAIGTVAKQQKDSGLDAAALARMLLGQKENIAAAMPAGFGELLKGSGLLDAVTASAPTPAHVGKPSPVESPATPGGNWFPWAAGFAALVIGIWYLLPSARGPTFPAPPAITVYNQNIGAQVGTLVEGLRGNLARITDEASARSALPALQETLKQLDGLTEVRGRMPADAKRSLAVYVSQITALLRPMVDGLLRQAGVSPVVKPVLDNILNRLDTMAKS